MSIGIPWEADAQAPKKVSLEGVVTEYTTKVPLAGCVVSIPTLDLWVVTDGKGKFKLPSVTTGTYNIEVNCLGYEPLSYNVIVKSDINNLALRMKESSLQLNTVTVTAKKGQSINSSSTIDRQAMDHLQATSVKDVMQLLPGAIMSNPQLNSKSFNFIGIRDLVTTGANDATSLNSSSVGVYLDGAMMSNDASIVGNKATVFAQRVDRGIDMRRISTDNIESVEVIRGVASAEYGNMSSGAVVVKTKIGRTPWEVSVKTVPDLKAVSLGKGFALGPDKGFINVGIDYANAMKDIRTQRGSYDRGTFSVGYNNTFNRNRTPLSFNVKVNGYISKGTTKPDQDNLSQDELESLNDKSLSINFNGTWLLNKSWITSLKYVVSSTLTDETARELTSPPAGAIANPGATVDGEYLAEYTPERYMRDIRNQSRALYNNAKLIGELSGRYGNIYNKAMIGLEWNNSGNTGKGQYYEGVRPNEFRPEPFSDLPFKNTLAAFVEEKATLPIGKTSLTLQAGARFVWMPSDVLKDNATIDPRFNAKYTIIQSKQLKGIRELSVRAGWGIQTTLPSLRMLYPFANYTDLPSLAWGGTSTLAPIAAVTTSVLSREAQQNRDLKMQHSKNLEVGIDFDMFGIKGGITYYNEKMRDGYSAEDVARPMSYREYAYNGDKTPVYIDDPKNPGQKVLGVDGKPLEYKEINVFRPQANKTGNSKTSDKWGVEYTLDFGQIRPIRTSIIVNGAYMDMTTKTNENELMYAGYNSNSKVQIDGKNVYNPYIASYYGSSNGVSMGDNRKRLNSNISFITHIPKLRLITSLTVQCIWIDKSSSIAAPGVYYNNDDGNRVQSGFENGIGGKTFYKDPDFYMDTNGNILPFNPALYEDPMYKNAFVSYRNAENNSSYFMENSFKPYFMANLRITKEIGRMAQLSFYANNFTNSRPMMRMKNGTYVQVNTPIYFGAEVKLKF